MPAAPLADSEGVQAMTDLQELRALVAEASEACGEVIGARADMDLIVAAVNALPALLDRLEQAEARNARLERVAEDWLKFAIDVQTSDAAGMDWLDNLKARTSAALNEPGEKP
jgi:hypothetical protein